MEIMLWISLGAFIGWNTSEPIWAFNIKQFIKNQFNQKGQ